MGYSANGSFADILRQAKAQAQLRGAPLNSSTIKSLGTGYFSDALDASNTDRAYNLANAQQLSQEEQFNKLYNLNSSQFAQSLAQQREMQDAQMDAADKATKQGYLTTGVSALGTGAMLLKGTDKGAALAKALSSLWESSGGGAANTSLTGSSITGASAPAYEATTAQAANASTPASSSLSSVATPVAIVTAAEMVKGKAGGMDKSWEQRDNTERLTSAPGTAGAFGPVGTVAMLADEDTFLGKIGKEASRLEQIVMSPIDSILGIHNSMGGSWLCTEIEKRHGMDDVDEKALSKLRRYSIKHHKEWARKYLKEGYRLVRAINAKGINYKALKESLIDKVCDLVRKGEMEEAHNVYKDITLKLCAEYGVEP